MIKWRQKLALACTSAVLSLAPAAHAAPQDDIAIVHGKLLTVTHGTIENGTLIMSEGKITGIGGPGTKVPPGIRVIDAKGRTVYPGLFDVDNSIGLIDPDSTRMATPTDDPAGTPVPWGFIADVVRPTDQVAVERYNGLTNAVVNAGSQGPLPGHSAVIQLVDKKADLVVDRDAGLVINFQGRRAADYPTTVFGIVGYVRQLLVRAGELAAGAKRRDDDAAAEAFIPYLGGKQRIIAHVKNDTEVGDALDLAAEFKLDIVLVGLADADTSLDRIATSGFPVVVGMLFDDPQPGRRYDQILRLPARMAEKGIPVSIGSLGIAGGPRNLPYLAGAAVAFGLPHDKALQAITLGPAKAFGLSDRLGSLDVGKAANIVIADGDPLDVTTDVLQVFIEGREADMTNRQTRLRDRYWPE
ncbi:amidohydrolase family protein [Sphingopyxis sp. J-6]|uniref:amidohydrolase family protein n=1 Tax=Sphingopyxis sp. J-6 TaxID=3122054 RepID=UPI003984447B